MAVFLNTMYTPYCEGVYSVQRAHMQLATCFPEVYSTLRVQLAIDYLSREILVAVRGCPSLYLWNREVVSPLLFLREEDCLTYIREHSWLNFSPAESVEDIAELKGLLIKYGHSSNRELVHYLWYHCCHYTIVLWYAVAKELGKKRDRNGNREGDGDRRLECEVCYQEQPRHVYLRVNGEPCDFVGDCTGVYLASSEKGMVYSDPRSYFIWFLIGEERYARWQDAVNAADEAGAMNVAGKVDVAGAMDEADGTRVKLQPWELETLRVLSEISR